MAGIHEALEIAGLSVGIENGIQIHTVITPSSLAGEIGDRHQLHVGDTQSFQIVQPGLCRFQSSLGRKRAQVQLVNKAAGKRRRLPLAVAPGERGMIDQPGRTMDTIRLPLASRIGEWGFQAIDHEPVVRARPGLLHGR